MENEKELTTYQKNKAAIYKWRNKNREQFLLSQHKYFKNKMEDPDKKNEHYERLERNRQKQKELKGTVKRGRPSKYNTDDERI